MWYTSIPSIHLTNKDSEVGTTKITHYPPDALGIFGLAIRKQSKRKKCKLRCSISTSACTYYENILRSRNNNYYSAQFTSSPALTRSFSDTSQLVTSKLYRRIFHTQKHSEVREQQLLHCTTHPLTTEIRQ